MQLWATAFIIQGKFVETVKGAAEMFKKTAAIFIAASLMLGAFSGCSLPATSLGNIAGQDEAESRTEPAVYI